MTTLPQTRRAVALTIAASDSGGGAGIVADAKTFEAHGVWAAVAVTAITAQNTLGVQRVDIVRPAAVRAQIGSVADDYSVGAVKTGMLGRAGVVATVAAALRELALGPLVVDPVLRSTSGAPLLDDDGVRWMRDHLLPMALLVTPNLAEAEALTGVGVTDRDGMVAAGRRLVGLGCGAALVTGGHLPGDVVADCLVVASGDPIWFTGARLAGRNTHGTGCVLSAAITARLAQGEDLASACGASVLFVRSAIIGGVELGAGPGAVDPGFS